VGDKIKPKIHSLACIHYHYVLKHALTVGQPLVWITMVYTLFLNIFRAIVDNILLRAVVLIALLVASRLFWISNDYFVSC
jgi:hypothetical protein